MALPPIIPDLPPAPSRSDGPAGFTPKADAMVAALQPMVTAQNQQASWMNDTAQQVHADAIYAATSATNAADSASAANTAKLAAQQAVTAAEQAGAEQVALAVAARDEAEAFAEAAGAGVPAERTPFTVLQVTAGGQVAWGYGLPDRTNAVAGQALVLGAGKVPGYAWVGQKVGDILVTSAGNTVDSTYIATDKVYLQSAYPALFSSLGLVGGVIGTDYSPISYFATRTANWVETDGNGVWICGGGSTTAYRSTDDGLNWSQITLPATAAAMAYGGNGVWVGVSSANMIRSINNGQSFAVVSGLVSGEKSKIASDGQGVFSCLVQNGSNTYPYTSTDAGATWAMLATWSVRTIMVSLGNGVWVSEDATGGTSGTLIRTTNNWASAAYNYAAVGANLTAGAASKSTPGVGVVAGGSGKSKRTEDYGLTWTNTGLDAGTAQATLVAAAPSGLFIVGYASGVQRSADEGKSFAPVSGWAAGTPLSLAFGKNGTGIEVGGNSTSSAYKTTPAFNYDPATQFRVPKVTTDVGLSSYIKAKLS